MQLRKLLSCLLIGVVFVLVIVPSVHAQTTSVTVLSSPSSANQIDSSAIVNLFSAIAALSAVILAIFSELRAQKRFKQSNDIQQRIAAANIKPLVIIGQEVADRSRKATLHNDGIGTAVMTNITFTKENRSGNSLPWFLTW